MVQGLSPKRAVLVVHTASDEGAATEEHEERCTDRGIEELLRAKIMEKFPEHGIFGEEFGMHNPDADYQWIIDPIDGTSSFIMGRPTFGTLIALAFKGDVIIGIVNQPIAKERWLGVDGEGAWFNGKPIKTRACADIEDAIISTTSDFFFSANDLAKFKKLSKMAKYQKFGGVIYGGDCYSYALLASGFVDIIVEPSLQVYDYAALIPIIKMAGGKIGFYDGEEFSLKGDAKILACANKTLFDKVLKVMQLDSKF